MTQDSATPLRPPPLCASQQQPGNSAHNNADAAAAAAAETMEDDRALTACFTRKNSRNVKRIGLIGYGHLGQFLRAELSKYSAFYAIRKIWNRTEESKENVLPLTHLDLHHHLHHHHRHHNGHHLHHNGGAGDGGGANGDGGAGADTGGGGVAAGGEDEEEEEEDPLADVELVIEVAHPEVVKRYAPRILQHCDLFIGSVAALADAATLEAVESALRKNRHRRVFVPSAASFWGTEDIRAMARMGTLKSLTITIMKHPSALRVLGPLNDLSQRALKTNFPVVLYDGPVRLLCASAPSIANMIASAALAAKNLGFDGTRVKLIADPAISNWGIVEYEALGENGFRSTCRRESPAQPGAVSNEDNTYFSILSSIRVPVKVDRVAEGCNRCETLKVLEGEKYTKFEKLEDTVDGCSRLKVTCGLDKNTEAIIQWYRDGQDFGVSFMEAAGQSKVERVLKCNNASAYELKENGAVEVVNEVACIVAFKHEEL